MQTTMTPKTTTNNYDLSLTVDNGTHVKTAAPENKLKIPQEHQRQGKKVFILTVHRQSSPWLLCDFRFDSFRLNFVAKPFIDTAELFRTKYPSENGIIIITYF